MSSTARVLTRAAVKEAQSVVMEGEIQQHLQAMLRLLRAQDTLKMAVRLECVLGTHSRYMAIVCAEGVYDQTEALILGIDHHLQHTTIGLVLPVWASTHIALDGDGGIVVHSLAAQHTFKPVSVQAMWSAFQSLHKEHQLATRHTYFPGGLTHTWATFYHANSPEAYTSEWHYTSSSEDSDFKADALDRHRTKPAERAQTEMLIREALKNIMQTVDLDEVTSKDIRQKLQEGVELNMAEYKEFIDQEMLVILGQMDKPSKIFDFLYLGTEWNASNWEELRQNNVSYILNVTQEVDNFFPGSFNYMKIRVTDEESSELLKHWDVTYKFINRAREQKQAVLVHCKKGISRSSSTVIAFAMKEYGWSIDHALNYVKDKRKCITPNKGFMHQLNTYGGILDASSHRRSALFNRLPMLFPCPSAPFINAAHIRAAVSDARSSVDSNPTTDVHDAPHQLQDESGRVMVSSPRKGSYSRSVSLDHGHGHHMCAPSTSSLLVASENILKSCAAPSFDSEQDNSNTDWTELLACSSEHEPVSVCPLPVSDPINTSTSNVPLLSALPPVRRTLQTAEHRIRSRQAKEDAQLTLKHMQTILMRSGSRRHSGGSGQSSSSGVFSCGEGSSGEDTTSLESTDDVLTLTAQDCDRAPCTSHTLPSTVLQREGSVNSCADSAIVVDTVKDINGQGHGVSVVRHRSNELYTAQPAHSVTRARSLTANADMHSDNTLANGQVRRVRASLEQHQQQAVHVVQMPVSQCKKASSFSAGRKLLDRLFTSSSSCKSPPNSVAADRRPSESENEKRTVSKRANGHQLKVSKPGSVKAEKEKLERLSRDASGHKESVSKSVSRSARSKSGSGHGHHDTVSHRAKHSAKATNQHTALRLPVIGQSACDENVVRSLVDVFESGAGCAQGQEQRRSLPVKGSHAMTDTHTARQERTRAALSLSMYDVSAPSTHAQPNTQHLYTKRHWRSCHLLGAPTGNAHSHMHTELGQSPHTAKRVLLTAHRDL